MTVTCTACGREFETGDYPPHACKPPDEPQLHPLDSCIRSALEHLEDAVREQDGTEHPAIWQLTEACKWLLAGLAALNAGSKTAANLQELKDEQEAAEGPTPAHGGAK